VAFKIRQNPFRRSPDPLVGCGRDTPPHTPLHAAPTHLQRSPYVPPPSILARSTPMLVNSAWPSLCGRQYDYQPKLGSKQAHHAIHFDMLWFRSVS